MAAHFIYTAEGAAYAMGLSSVSALLYHIKVARGLGIEVSKVIGGVEYFALELFVKQKKVKKVVEETSEPEECFEEREKIEYFFLEYSNGKKRNKKRRDRKAIVFVQKVPDYHSRYQPIFDF